MLNKEHEEFCIQILKELQKELGGEITEFKALVKKTLEFDWWIDIREYDNDITPDTYCIWAWVDVAQPMIINLADPKCFQKVINHINNK